MQIQIKNERVRKNVQLFLHILGHVLANQQRKQLDQKVYRAWVNRINGEVIFSDLLPEPSSLNKKDWKAIFLHCDLAEGKLHFEVAEGDAESNSFHCKELAPLAYQTVAETVHELNRCAEFAQLTVDPKQQLEELSHLAIEPTLFQEPYDLIRAAWHPLNRAKAEELLFQRPYGSFLFRKDDYAIWLEEMLSRQHGLSIICTTLTFIEPEKKVTDLTLVSKGDKLLVYNDDPLLSGPQYLSLHALLKDIAPSCRYPVFH